MATGVEVTQSDVVNIATKLNALSTVLNTREQYLMASIFGLAQAHIEATADAENITGGEDLQTELEAPNAAPAMSEAFGNAMEPGLGLAFEIIENSPDPSLAHKIKIKCRKKYVQEGDVGASS